MISRNLLFSLAFLCIIEILFVLNHSHGVFAVKLKMRVAIIGCGPSGIAAIRRCIECGMECVAFERTSDIGGTWVLEEKVGNDEFGLPVHSSMYSTLRLIAAKELMEYPGFKYEADCKTYPGYKEVYRYLHEFANVYNLWPYIKLGHYVEKVKRVDKLWQVVVKDLKKNTQLYYEFDAVIIANGHNSVPKIPNIRGMDTFKGIILHSHDYRTPYMFRNKKVVIVGAGATGMDLTHEFENVTEVTYLSSNEEFLNKLHLPKNVIFKPVISSVSSDGVIFMDQSAQLVDIILFCTGYKYACSFLDESCGIKIGDKFIYPLFKELFNISEPSMCFLGIMDPFIVFQGVDVQVQVFLKTLKGLIQLPSKNEMMKILHEELRQKENCKIPKNKVHHLDKAGLYTSKEYIQDLEKFGGLKPLPGFLYRMYEINNEQYECNYRNLRNLTYNIIDEDNVVCLFPETSSNT